MNKLLGNAPRHPGLWLDEVRDTDTDWQHTPISCMPTQTQGQHELVQLSAQLAQLSQQGRWVVLINPPSIGYKQLLANAGVRMDRILLVHAKDEVETLWAMEKALKVVRPVRSLLGHNHSMPVIIVVYKLSLKVPALWELCSKR